MSFTEFIRSLEQKDPPSGLNILLLALWHDAKGDWEKSHDLVSEVNTKEAARIHAYLHRKEGDIWNADYWYSRSGEKRTEISLEKEWEELVRKFTV